MKYLQELGLSPLETHTPEDVKKAWKKKCQEHHPDKHQGAPDQEEQNQKFLSIMHAYKMLTDPSYRASEGNKKTGEHLDLHIRMNIPISFENAFFGADMGIAYNRVEIDNKGTPIIKEQLLVEYVTCSVPPGSVNGFEYNIAGKGIIQGNRSGNLIMMFHPISHPRFKVVGKDIVCEEPLPLLTLLKGGVVQVQTMYGLQELCIPAGTQPFEKLCIAKHGVNRSGKHIVVVKPIFPSKHDLKEDESWKRLDINWELKKDEEEDNYNNIYEELRKNFAERAL
jgi:DnaJ-class molecular chaperone